MLRRPGSPPAVFSAIALTTATLLAGAWEAGGHGHDTVETNVAYCVADHEAEASGIANGATLGQAAAPHDHSCVACKLGRTRTVENRRSSIAGLDLFPAESGSDPRSGPSAGERWQQSARGPPTG
ncbi:MAG: hypothetical protein OXI49_13880 [Acidobacteriota bacterium]|nr:hypothetical protein [Acidobacteriota bacterium]